ncbi:dihydropteroate synthase [Brevundimonas subvibrioides]|uniref:Dihydropteroate synthase n=1 Tax=Brevundimonas subvibrioides (strain ATCC 15264 / DSM 4735 / LMG 14903 / NBRC 16000 / CB 81) TaxID=633149 RepID=D9QML4_BRESC|nr:dihydropteroate synthase [Brevundimonas subvibrioides]ADL00184.1 dihydropteroate synthase [Brevundimonas subvibrioides ATCC 15264]
MTRPRVMGILNVTPDSFSDGGRHASVEGGLAQAMKLIGDGADILDIGGESTRPGAEPVPADEEIARTLPVIEAVHARWHGPISIDTMKPEVARAAMAAGATIWNDVTALTFSPDSPAVAADLGCEVVLMHMLGEPRSMQVEPRYDDVVAEVTAYLAERARVAEAAGVSRGRITLDPGVGFGKTIEHNLALIAGLGDLVRTGYPVLMGASRKRMIRNIDPSAVEAGDRLGGSLAIALDAAARGASIVRVHDVRETVQALAMQAAIGGAAS